MKLWLLAFSCYLGVCWVFVLLLPPHNRSPCLLMPGTPPGCHLMAGRDKRSSMETGKYSPQSHSLTLFQVKIYCLPALFFFYFFLKSIKITTSCYPVPSICCHDLVYDWFESLAECLHWNVRKRQARLADASDSSDTENWSRSRSPYQSTEPRSELGEGEVVILRKTSLADSERNCQPVCGLYLVTSS